MSSIGSTRRVTRSASRASSSDGSTAVGPDITTRTLRSGSRARSTAGSSGRSVARSAVAGSVVGSVAGSSRPSVLPGNARAAETAYGDGGPAYHAQQVALAGVTEIKTVVEEAHTADIDGVIGNVGQLSMIEEEGSGFDEGMELPEGTSAALTEANLTAANLAAEILDRDRTYTREDHEQHECKRSDVASTTSWTLLNILKWASVLFLLMLALADIYRGPLFGHKYDLLRWRSDVLNVPKNSKSITSPDLGILTRRFDVLERQFQKLSKIPRTSQTDQPKVHKINWFSPGLGALAAPKVSSPTRALVRSYQQSKRKSAVRDGTLTSWLSSRLPSWFPGQKYDIEEVRDIEEALLPWHDVGDCWCAPSTRGKLQLAVALPRWITPTELVVEHIPKGEIYDIGNAPKEIELWMQINSEEIREQVVSDMTKMFPDIYKDASQRGKGSDTVRALDKTFVPVGRWTYDIHAGNHVQTFAMSVDLEKWNGANSSARTRRVVFRANSNWGSTDSTCLYRVKLHGRDPWGAVVYEDLEEM